MQWGAAVLCVSVMTGCTLTVAADGSRTWSVDGVQAAKAAAVVLDSGK